MRTLAKSHDISPINGKAVYWDGTAFAATLDDAIIILTKPFDPARDIVYLSTTGTWPTLKLCERDNQHIYVLNDCLIELGLDGSNLNLTIAYRIAEVL